MASRGNKRIAGQNLCGKPSIAPNQSCRASVPGKPQGSSEALVGVDTGVDLQSAVVAKVAPGCGGSSDADLDPDLTATDGVRSGSVSGKSGSSAGVPDKAAGSNLSPGAGTRSGKEQAGGVSGCDVLGRGGIGRAGSSVRVERIPGGLAGQGINPDNPKDSSGAAPRVAVGSSGVDVMDKNRSFWEAKNARIWNRERGVGIKHYPELLGARKITISLDQWNKGVEKLDNALVGIVFGEKPNLGHMRGYAKARWQDRVKVAMLNDGIFLFKFSSEELRSEVLFGGPLTFNHKPLVFQRWDPDVSYTCSSVKSIPVWVRLPGLRAHFQEDEELLGMICSVIGKPLKTDGYTAKRDLMTFARACIEIYSDQEYPDRVTITDPFGNDLIQEIKYEWLPKRCVNCCSFGHLKEECDMPSLETVESEEESDESNEDHCDPEALLVEDKDIHKDLDEVVVDSARKSPDFPQDFLDIPSKSPELPGKVQGSPGENTEDSETEEGEVIPDTQDTSPAPSVSNELLDKALDDFERQGDCVGVVSKKRKKPKDKDKEKIEVLVRRELRSARDKGGGSNVTPRRGRGRGKRR